MIAGDSPSLQRTEAQPERVGWRVTLAQRLRVPRLLMVCSEVALMSGVGLALLGPGEEVSGLVVLGSSGLPFSGLLGWMRCHESRPRSRASEIAADVLGAATMVVAAAALLILIVGSRVAGSLAFQVPLWAAIVVLAVLVTRLGISHLVVREVDGEVVLLSSSPDAATLPGGAMSGDEERGGGVRTIGIDPLQPPRVDLVLEDLRAIRPRAVIVDLGLVSAENTASEGWMRLADGLEALLCPVWLAMPRRAGRFDQLMARLSPPPIDTTGLLVKRGVDIAGAFLALVLLAPLMVLIAIAIKLDSSGPVLFLQRRHGLGNEVFKILKFRSMTNAARDEGGRRLTSPGDARLTRLGGFLRRSSLDELPQFINVLKGDMSLVGPRPHPLEACAGGRPYAEVVPQIDRRHRVKPGITGLAQIRGLRGNTDTEQKLIDRVRHDLAYIDQWSLWLDLEILVVTPVATVTAQNAY